MARDKIVSGNPVPVVLFMADREGIVSALRSRDGGLLIVDVVHNRVHSGQMFHVEHAYIGVLNNNNADLRLKTGARETHSTFSVSAGGQVTVSLFEGATISVGTPLTIYNLRRTSIGVPLAIVTYAPTVSATGSVAIVDGRLLAGGTTPGTRVGGDIRQGTELILKPNTEYLFRANNSSGGTIAINIGLEFYEEDEG